MLAMSCACARSAAYSRFALLPMLQMRYSQLLRNIDTRQCGRYLYKSIDQTKVHKVHKSHRLMVNTLIMKFKCLYLDFLCIGMAVPYHTTDCNLSLPTTANWRRVLMRHRRFHFMIFSTIFV